MATGEIHRRLFRPPPDLGAITGPAEPPDVRDPLGVDRQQGVRQAGAQRSGQREQLLGVRQNADLADDLLQRARQDRVKRALDGTSEPVKREDILLADRQSAELAAAGCPALLIPYPHGDGHQCANAQWWVEAGAAVLFEERSLTVAAVAAWLQHTLQDQRRLDAMAAAAARLARPEAARRLAQDVLALAGWTTTPQPVALAAVLT